MALDGLTVWNDRCEYGGFQIVSEDKNRMLVKVAVIIIRDDATYCGLCGLHINSLNDVCEHCGAEFIDGPINVTKNTHYNYNNVYGNVEDYTEYTLSYNDMQFQGRTKGVGSS